MIEAACTGEPISWLRLERFALGATDDAIAAHIAACPACSRCLDEIRGGDHAIGLPPLIGAPPARTRRWLAPAWLIVAAAALAVVVVVRRDPDREPERADVVRVKGVGEVVLGTVRERSGTIRDDMPSFAAGDRWKVVVTCPPAARAWIDVAVVDTHGVDYPLAPALVSCGNRVVVPGAFTITGSAANRICVRVDAGVAPLRAPPRAGDPGVACVTLYPE